MEGQASREPPCTAEKHYAALLLTGSRAGMHTWEGVGWARFRRGELINGTPAVVRAYDLLRAELFHTER